LTKRAIVPPVYLTFQLSKMNCHQLFLKYNQHQIFSGFTTALMQAYSLADKGNKHQLANAFPEYFIDDIDPEILKDLDTLNKKG